MASFTRVLLRLTGENGKPVGEPVDAVACGLWAVDKRPGRLGTPASPWWHVTHIPTGLHVAAATVERSAMSLAAQLHRAVDHLDGADAPTLEGLRSCMAYLVAERVLVRWMKREAGAVGPMSGPHSRFRS